MPAPRSYSPEVEGTNGLGHHRSTLPPECMIVRQVSARDLGCPECGALPSTDCSSGRMSAGKKPVPLMCPSRLEMARSMRDLGEMTVAQFEAQPACRKCAYYGGKLHACEEHKRNPPEPSKPALGPKKPGRPSGTPNAGRPAKLTDDQRAEIARRYLAGGVTLAALGAEFGVHETTVKKVIKAAAAP